MESFVNRFGFENLEVYQLGMELIEEIYKTTDSFPKAELYRLIDQLHRAANSVVLNIAEGRGRNTDKDFARFLHQSRGSLLETVAALQIAVRLKFLSPPCYEELASLAGKTNAKLNALISTLEK